MIEVVLVLAIAGLIFIMIFVALPSLQRSQRDNDRKDDMLKFISEVKRYQTNNRGALPGSSDLSSFVQTGTVVSVKTNNYSNWGNLNIDKNSWKGFYKDYLGGNFMDPDGVMYNLDIYKCTYNKKPSVDSDCTAQMDAKKTFQANNYTLMVILEAKCGGDNKAKYSSPRNLAILYRLETGVYCDAT